MVGKIVDITIHKPTNAEDQKKIVLRTFVHMGIKAVILPNEIFYNNPNYSIGIFFVQKKQARTLVYLHL